MPARSRTLLLVLSATLLLVGCSLPYYLQAARGHLALMGAREDIAELVADGSTDPALRERLRYVLAVRAFASEALGLPANDSYTQYAALERDYVVWNVFATEEFSIAPRTWCFPVAGCVAYRGYFSEARARRYADGLAADGYDTWVGGVSAYSTLGRFDDPVLDTMLRYDDAHLAELIFHELAHQKLYVKGDSAFNEAYATVVAEAGMARWLAQRGEDAADWRRSLHAAEARQAEFTALLLATRSRLEALYAEDLPAAVMRAQKAAEFQRLREDWAALRERWGGGYGYDAWFQAPLNNARLVPVATYEGLAPALRRLLDETCAGDIGCFHEEAAALGALSYEARRAALGS